MPKILDFSKSKKPTVAMKLPDGTTVNLFTPSKELMEEILDSQEVFESASSGNREKLDELYNLAARLMSNNKEERDFSSDDVEGMLSTKDIQRFIHGYAEFVAEQSNEKN